MKNNKLGRPLRLGMVGGGRNSLIGCVHKMAAQIDDRYELVAGSLSSDSECADSSAEYYGISSKRSYTDYNLMAIVESHLKDGIDVVSIVTPNYLHFPIAKVFLEHGIDVICDKPMTMTVKEAKDLSKIVLNTGQLFALTYTYTGHPLVRQAKEIIASGQLGPLRTIQIEYSQQWLTRRLEDNFKTAEWRTDPARSGLSNCVGDIGTHAYNLIRFITGLHVTEVLADLDSFVEGRILDDNAHILLRFNNGVKGMMWASQVAPGNTNNLRIRIYGEKSGLEWAIENPNELIITPFEKNSQNLEWSSYMFNKMTMKGITLPDYFSEGFLEAFNQLYNDMADQIEDRIMNCIVDSENGLGLKPNYLLLPTVDDGVLDMRFVEAVVESNKRNSVWVRL